MKVSHLYIYPIKSLQGIEVQAAQVLEKGFQYDRRWMLVDENNFQLTQRTHPHLSQIKIELKTELIVASHKGYADMQIPLTIEKGPELEVKVWEHTVKVVEASADINAWFSAIAKEKCRLVHMPANASRPANPKRARFNEHVSLADAYPYLIIGQSSLEDLNVRLDKPVPMHRFRPNIVVTGTEPYAEDEWRDFQIGDLPFYGTHGCKRCVFITIDQETGKKSKEPLKTLSTYRKDGNEIYFGLNSFAKVEGTMKVGDSIGF